MEQQLYQLETDPELRRLTAPLNLAEFNEMEEEIKKNGGAKGVKVWGKTILVDYEYYEYCHKQKVYEVDESQAIGLDFSPEEFYINSDGSSGKDFGYVAQKQKNLKKLTKLQRRLARKQVGSNNREKARVKVARMEHYIAECRNDWIEKETKR